MGSISRKVFFTLNSLGLFNRMSDKNFLKLRYKCQMGKSLNLNCPKSFNEKLQWIKLYDRKQEYRELVDKYEVKKYISNILGNEFIIPTLGVYDSFDEINFNELPNKFVLKCTHDSGSVIICKNKSDFPIDSIKNKVSRCLKKSYYYSGREWPYKDLKPRIIIEKYMGNEMYDYKFQCFNGKIDHIFVCEGRNTKRGVRYYYFDKDWNYLDYCHYDDIDLDYLKTLKPDNFNDMIKNVEKLCKDFIEIRIDLYNIDGKIYFGEFTFFTSSGFDTTITSEADLIIGKRLDLNRKNSGG